MTNLLKLIVAGAAALAFSATGFAAPVSAGISSDQPTFGPCGGACPAGGEKAPEGESGGAA
jgi:hypothetical protein